MSLRGETQQERASVLAVVRERRVYVNVILMVVLRRRGLRALLDGTSQIWNENRRSPLGCSCKRTRAKRSQKLQWAACRQPAIPSFDIDFTSLRNSHLLQLDRIPQKKNHVRAKKKPLFSNSTSTTPISSTISLEAPYILADSSLSRPRN